MKKKDLADLRNKEEKELNKLYLKKKEELIKAKINLASQEEKNLKKARNIRKEIAQILSLIKEKDIIRSLEKK